MIDSEWCLPWLIPGHSLPASCHASGVVRFDGQSGHVRHCKGRVEWIEHFVCPDCSRTKNSQSPPFFSSKLSRTPTRRTCRLVNSSRVSPKWAAIRSHSSREIHTWPGAPLQHTPHCVQVKRSPSVYQIVPHPGPLTKPFHSTSYTFYRTHTDRDHCDRRSGHSWLARRVHRGLVHRPRRQFPPSFSVPLVSADTFLRICRKDSCSTTLLLAPTQYNC